MGEIILNSNNYIIYHDTPWDARVLGCRTNEIKEIVFSSEELLHKLIIEFEEFCINENYLFTNTRINPDDKILRKVLSDQGFFNTETSSLIERNINNLKQDDIIKKVNFNIREYKPEDFEEIQSIAFDEFSYGRFFEDPYISIENARIRYKNWVIDLLTSSKIIVGEINSTVFGFMAFKVEGSDANIMLGGVKSNYAMFSYPFWYKFFLELNIKFEIKNVSALISASNIRILNLYSYFGFKFSKTFFGYHKHRNL